MRYNRHIGIILLAIFLVLWGLMSLFGFGGQVLTIILAIVAIAAGIFLFLDR